jgi:predicted nuclease of predicted toxin-antitoxin system
VIRFLVDEDFNNDLVRGVLRRLPAADVVRVQDLGMRGATDDAVLERAASEERIVLTHDVATLIGKAHERVREGRPMPGVNRRTANAARQPGHR